MDSTTLIGVVGAEAVLALLLFGQFNSMTVEDIWYDAGNILGSKFLMMYILFAVKIFGVA